MVPDDECLPSHTSQDTFIQPADHCRPKQFKIGLDYGATYSAGAFALCSGSSTHLQSGKIYPFYGLDPGLSESIAELSSDILYNADGIAKIGHEALNSTVSAGHCVRGAKLSLHNNHEAITACTALTRDLEQLPASKEPAEVISDYLAELFSKFKEQLTQNGYNDGDTIEFNCVVPSIWTKQTLKKMAGAIKSAAERSKLALDAGIKLWPEAEAATEHVVSEHPNLNLQKEDVFMVCDAGGGTVDLATYSVEGAEPLHLNEVVERAGALCGSTLLDEGFLKHIEARAQACLALTTNKSEKSIQKQLHLATKHFGDYIKHNFSGLTNGNYPIPFAGLPEDTKNGFHEDEMIIESKELVPIFEEVAEKIWVEIRSQLHQAEMTGHHPVKLIILTGGLSQSPFVRQYIGKKLPAEVQQPEQDARIELVLAPTVEFGVAAGAIRCSLKVGKENQTRRISDLEEDLTPCLGPFGLPVGQEVMCGPNDEEICMCLNEIESKLRRLANSLESELNISLASVSGIESPDTRRLFQAALGCDAQGWFSPEFTDADVNRPKRRRLLRAILAAAITSWVFRPPEFLSNDDSILLYHYQTEIFNKHGMSSLEDLHRQVLMNVMGDASSLNDFITKKATDLSDRCLKSLLPIISQRNTVPSIHDWVVSSPTNLKRQDNLVGAFGWATTLELWLSLRGKRFEIYVPPPGSRPIEELMVSLGGTNLALNEAVNLCLMPAIIEYSADQFKFESSGPFAICGKQNFVTASEAQRKNGRVISPAVITTIERQSGNH